jgi:hypothetical protein
MSSLRSIEISFFGSWVVQQHDTAPISYASRANCSNSGCGAFRMSWQQIPHLKHHKASHWRWISTQQSQDIEDLNMFTGWSWTPNFDKFWPSFSHLNTFSQINHHESLSFRWHIIWGPIWHHMTSCIRAEDTWCIPGQLLQSAERPQWSSRYVTRLGTDLRRVLQVISPRDVFAKRVAGPGSPEVSRVEIWCHIWNTTKLPQCHAICKTSALCKSTPTSGSSQAEVNKWHTQAPFDITDSFQGMERNHILMFFSSFFRSKLRLSLLPTWKLPAVDYKRRFLSTSEFPTDYVSPNALPMHFIRSPIKQRPLFRNEVGPFSKTKFEKFHGLRPSEGWPNHGHLR